MSKIIISLSGGVDSATALAIAKKEGHECHAVSFVYGSKHGKYENVASSKLSTHYKLESWRKINLETVMKDFDSHLLESGGDIPEGHYEDESMSQTVVPARNIIFSSILAGLAWSIEASEVWLGVHAGDHAIYPDCRPEFIDAMRRAIDLGTDGKVMLTAPLLHLDKKRIVELGKDLKVPFQITRTCYKKQELACGKCGSCRERLEAFSANGLLDPIQYMLSPENAI